VGLEVGPVEMFCSRKEPKIARKKVVKMALFRECEAEYQSETRLLPSKHDAKAL
jgi:hypothetical protein